MGSSHDARVFGSKGAATASTSACLLQETSIFRASGSPQLAATAVHEPIIHPCAARPGLHQPQHGVRNSRVGIQPGHGVDRALDVVVVPRTYRAVLLERVVPIWANQSASGGPVFSSQFIQISRQRPTWPVGSSGRSWANRPRRPTASDRAGAVTHTCTLVRHSGRRSEQQADDGLQRRRPPPRRGRPGARQSRLRKCADEPRHRCRCTSPARPAEAIILYGRRPPCSWLEIFAHASSPLGIALSRAGQARAGGDAVHVGEIAVHHRVAHRESGSRLATRKSIPAPPAPLAATGCSGPRQSRAGEDRRRRTA